MPEMREADVREYLSDRGLTPAQVDRVLYTYNAALAVPQSVTAGQITADPIAWLDTQVHQFTGRSSRPPGAEAPGRTSGESERAFVAVQEMAREASARRRQEVQDRFYRTARIDHGPVMDPDIIANTLGTGAWVDAEGNYIDPNTGQQSEEPFPADANDIWHQLKGQWFNMGSLAMPGGPTIAQQTSRSYYPHGYSYRPSGITHPSADTMARSPSMRRQRGEVTAGVNPVRPRTFVTPSMALSLLSSMSEDYLIQLQHQMYDAGLYPEDTRPRWGHPDDSTREAFKRLFVEASQTPDKNLAAVLADRANDLRDSTSPAMGSPGAGGPSVFLPDFQPTVANEEEMRQNIDQIAQETLGRFLPPAERDALVGRLRDREVALQRQQYERDVGQTMREARFSGPEGGGGTLADVDAFLAALSGQESGGNYGAVNRGSGARGKYQIMPANWADWSRRAGLPPGSPQTPQNQEMVARQIVMDYYERYGNWRDVAVAWYSGPGNVASKRYSDRAQRGGPSINDYADSVMTRMAGTRRGAMGGGPGGMIGGQEFAPIEEFDPAAEARAALRAADPAGWQATEWSNRAAEFFGALGPVLGSVR